MANLNKPAKAILVDLINSTSRRINPHWVDIPVASLNFGAPAEITREAQYDYRNTYVNAFDVSDVAQSQPYRINYDRIDLKDLTRKYEDDMYVYLPIDTTSVSNVNLLSAINSAAGTQIVAGDIVQATINTPSFPMEVEITANADSLMYRGVGKMTLSIPTASVVYPFVGEMSALMARRLAVDDEDMTVANNHGFVLTYGLPANVGVSTYMEQYDRTAGDLRQERVYSHYATLADVMIVEPYSVIQFTPSSQINFRGEAEDFLDKIAQIGEELCLIQGVTFDATDTSLVVELALRRALDDTIPVMHAETSPIYVLNESGPKGLIPVDKLNNINVKLLAKIGSDIEPEGGVDYMLTTFSNRLNRPYPVRNVRVNGLWESGVQGVGREYTVTWEHHRRFDDSGDRTVDELGWFDHAVVEAGDDGIEYQVHVYVTSSNALLYSSPRLANTVNSHTFEMPEFDGGVYLQVHSLNLSVEAYQTPTLHFDVVEGSGFAPIFGTLELTTDATHINVIVDVASPGSPVSTGMTESSIDYPYNIEWQVDIDGTWTTVDTDVHAIAFADVTAHSGREIRARLSMSNVHGDVYANSFAIELP